jgi:hypothetical protein
MSDSTTPAALHAALQFLITSDLPAQHKAVLIETVTQALRDQESVHLLRLAAEQAGGQWQGHETEQVQSFLQGRVANSWQQADELLMHLAAQLHRNPRDVRAKATELGFGEGVDYSLAKKRPKPRDD